MSFGRYVNQIGRAVAASSRERQRRQERAAKDWQKTVDAINAEVDKIAAEWDKIIARVDNYEAAQEQGKRATRRADGRRDDLSGSSCSPERSRTARYGFGHDACASSPSCRRSDL
ncbi:hypothetical protein [Candidatus Poriferisodalis sp.]|uniref:hypothetical protein n=1 Tax=Candidatus Poriferisodalis sp. TaxID=3101277 RepID=UPI003C6F1EBA